MAKKDKFEVDNPVAMQGNPYDKVQLALTCLQTFILVILMVGLFITQTSLINNTDKRSKDDNDPPAIVYNPDNFANQELMAQYCDSSHFLSCFELVSEVEDILRTDNKDRIFEALAALEPQTGPIVYWGVDESEEEADDHLDLGVVGTVDYFNNPAYFYSVDVHRASVDNGGWGLSFWKTLPTSNNTVYIALQLFYCERSVSSTVRVCGAFNLRSEEV